MRPDSVLDAGDAPDSSDDTRPDVGDTAADVPDMSGEALGLWRVTLSDGEEVVGEPIVTYDHNRWWEPEPTQTHALFDVSALRPFPDDRSLRFVDQATVRLIEPFVVYGRRPYRQALRDEGIVLERSPLEVVAHVFTGHDSYHLEEQGYGDYAWDFVVTDERGTRYLGDGSTNQDYRVWGQRVVLPTAGYVVEVVRDAPDNPVGESPPLGAPNNLVGVHLGGSYYLYLLHFQQGSIPDSVAVDAYLEAGTFLGLVGNSGVTLEPHLHVTVLWYDDQAEPARSWSVPSEFRDVWVGRTPAGSAQMVDFVDPPTGVWLSSEEF